VNHAPNRCFRFYIAPEFFNLFNLHNFAVDGRMNNLAFTTDIASPDFGLWNGSVMSPRNIQLGARVEF
jgi:hypothetical protein